MSFDTTICSSTISVAPELIYRTSNDNLLTSLTLSVIGPVENSTQIRLTSTTDSDLYLVGSVVNFVATDEVTPTLTFDMKVWRTSAKEGSSSSWYVSPESVLLNVEIEPTIAEAGNSANLSIINNPAIVFEQSLVMAKSARFDIEDYFVVEGYPVALDGYGAKLTVSASIGTNTTNQTRPQFYDIDMESDSRWVALPNTYEDGLAWYPYSGQYRIPLNADPVYQPALVSDHVRQYGNSFYENYAMILTDGDHFSLSKPFVQNYLTIIMAGILNEPENEWYGIISSGDQDAYNTDESPNISLRYYANGTLELHFINTMATLNVTTLEIGSLKPIIMGLSVSIAEKTAKMLVIDASGSQHIQTVTLSDFQPSDADLFIGVSPSRNNTYASEMDIFEINQYVQQLDDQEISEYMSRLGQIYGVIS